MNDGVLRDVVLLLHLFPLSFLSCGVAAAVVWMWHPVGDYGHQDITATVGGPLGPVKFFGAVRSSKVDDWNPSFYQDFKIDMDGDGAADLLDSYQSGVTADGDQFSVDFDTEDGK